jgi:hypothetical protein
MEARQDFALVEAKKSLLGGTDLMDVHVIVSSGHETLDRGGMRCGIRTADERARDVLLAGQAKHLLEELRGGNLGRQPPGQRGIWPVLERDAPRRALLFGPANRQMAVTRLRPSTGSDERLDELPVRLEADETVADARC